MGLVGIIDPSHEERKKDREGRLPKWFPRDELLTRFETASPKFSPYSYEVVAAALDQWEDRDYISTTMLVGGCARSKVLERREDFVLDLDGLWPAFRGTQVHRTLEFSFRPGAIAEGRFFTTLYVPGKGDVEVSCSPDVITPRPAAVVDYKAPVDDRSIPSWGYNWPSYIDQLQFNRYIVNHAERWVLPEGVDMAFDPRTLVFKHLYIVYLGSRGPKVIECQKAVDQPMKTKEGTKTVKVPDVWSDEYVEERLLPRLLGMVKALDGYPEWPEGLEEFPGFEGPALPDWLIQAHLDNGAPDPRWKCPGKPWCKLPDCLAKRYPYGLIWENPPARERAR